MHLGMLPWHIEQWVQKQCLAQMGSLGTQIASLAQGHALLLGRWIFSLVAMHSLTFGKLESKDAIPFISCWTPHCMANTSLDSCCSPSNIARKGSLLSSGSAPSKEAMLEAVHEAARNACQGCVRWGKVGYLFLCWVLLGLWTGSGTTAGSPCSWVEAVLTCADLKSHITAKSMPNGMPMLGMKYFCRELICPLHLRCSSRYKKITDSITDSGNKIL